MTFARFAAVRRPKSLAERSAAVVLLIAWGVSCVGDAPPRFQQPDACALVLACYFSDNPSQSLAGDPAFEGLFPGGDAQLVVDTYGPAGSCWRGDELLATSCADRCKGLLWQDCAIPYRLTCVDENGADTGALCDSDSDCGAGRCPIRPFCAEACNVENALPCRFQDFAKVGGQRQANAPLFSACPSGATCNAEEPALQDNTRPPERFGCCDLPSHLGPDGERAPIIVGSNPTAGADDQPCATTLAAP